ncbi:ser/threonine protein phosphatase [Fervidicella metallireducens AeB]|uniref:Ser/threonine protein phosphatase n=1 Tax=Fervidicella metallireducens AeB TaxID=1403537 RepID=A0A017RWX1_9CLOT|nr:metallophosphoesterase [Fervidicella metallireducens]EYE89041.1 ser/threonine protein phosphatase [Fervidicella metallireducens AeB]
MGLYAISDLHLSLSSNKPMDVFGELWKDHHMKIMENWNSKITNEDVVLISGDISWAMKLSDALVDLEYIHRLNGKKILIKGNHDYWWSSISKLNSLYEDMNFIQNTHFNYEDYAICGTRGWINIDDNEEHDEKVYNREILRLKMSLDSAVSAGYDKILVMMHYPPVTRISKSKEFIDIINDYKVEKVIYGHIHYDSKAICINGVYNDVQYICTSADIINFDPIRIL